MAGALQGLTTATVVVREAWEHALPEYAVRADGNVSLQVAQMDDDGLLVLLDRVTEVGRQADALTAALAAELASRSPLGSRESLAHRKGFGSPGKLVAASTRGNVGRAVMMTAVGRATATRRALTGEVLPAAHPHVARVVQAGRVSTDAAHLIVTMLDGLSSRVAVDEVDRAEALLAEEATRFALDDVRRLVERMEARLDPDGVEPREEVLRTGRSLTMVQDRKGRFQLRGTFDPETGAPIKAALDAGVTSALRAARGNNHPGESCGTGSAAQTDGSVAPAENTAAPSGNGRSADSVTPVIAETRSAGQIAADVLADIARHVLACADRVPGLPAAAVVVRMDLQDLQRREGGCGFATLDGVDRPVSVATARRMACAAGLIPAVFGGASVPLDLGRSSRLFSRAQFLALWERDGGCASCGQVTFVEAHHVHEWENGGSTDLRNGVLLCSRCHHRVHADGWEIGIGSDGVSFVPPRSIDPSRRPRPGVARQPFREQDRPTDPLDDAAA